MYELIIFDIDGTMIDTQDAVKKSYRYAVKEELGRDLADDEILRIFGIPTLQALEALGVKDTERASGKFFESLFKYYREGMPVYKGIKEVLEELDRRGVTCGIVTSRNRGEVSNDASLGKMLKYFRYVITAEDTSKHKPDAEPVLKLLEVSGADPSGVIYIGDTYFDYLCAKNASVKFALAVWGAESSNGMEPDYVLGKPSDLLKILDQG